MVSAKLPTWRASILPPDYAGHKKKDLAMFIRKVKTVLEFDAAIYRTERYQMLIAKQYLVDDATAE